MVEVPAIHALQKVLMDTGTAIRITNGGLFAIIPATGSSGKIEGIVVDQVTRVPLAGVHIMIPDEHVGTATDEDGRYEIADLPHGVYSLEVSMIGYEKKQIDDIVLLEDATVTVNIELQQETVLLKELTVTPGQFSIMGTLPTVRQSLTREDIQTIPLGDDVHRAIIRLPGISAGDFSAKFSVRGGENEEVLVLLDGMELYEPFHLKEIEGGAVSIIEVETVESIDLMTGGFPAEYGDHLSGVFNIQTTEAAEGNNRTSLGLSVMNARIMSQGSFDDSKGSWLLSARKGYLDMVLTLMNEQYAPRPTYYDVLAKISYQLDAKHTLSTHFLYADDQLDYTEDDKDVSLNKYGNMYGWVNLRSVLSPRLYVRSIASYGRLYHDREGTGYEGDSRIMNFHVSDDRKVDTYGLKQDWSFDVSDRWFMKWGFDVKHSLADYEYRNTIRDIWWISENVYHVESDSTYTDLTPEGTKIGAYLSSRFQVTPQLTAEIGLRNDFNSFTDDQHLSPRFNVLYALGPRTFARTGWGYFYQSQGIHELQIVDGEKDFYPAELARHLVAGLEHTFSNGVNFRVEAYHKALSHLRPSYRNWTNEIEVFPEAQSDRIRLNRRSASAKGLEFYLKFDQGRKVNGWATYALSFADDQIRNLDYAGTERSLDKNTYPGRYDQRHTFSVDLNYKPNRKWHFNVSWQYHSGWPYSELTMRSARAPNGALYHYSTYETYFNSNYPPYHRMDLFVNRFFYTPFGRFSVYISLINAYNHGNVRDVDYNWMWNPNRNRPFLEPENDYWFKALPIVGISWSQ